MLDARGFGVRGGFGDADGIDIDAKSVCAVFPGRRHGNPAIAAAQVNHEILFLDVCQYQHAIDDLLRRRDVRRELCWVGALGRWSLDGRKYCRAGAR